MANSCISIRWAFNPGTHIKKQVNVHKKKESVIHADETFSNHSLIVVGGVGARQYTFKSLEIKVPYLMFHPDKMK